MIRRLLSAAAFVLLASTAQAAPINLLLTTNHSFPTGITPIFGVHFAFDFYESPTNLWPCCSGLPTRSTSLSPGVNEFHISLDVDTLDDVYFAAYGTYTVLQPEFAFSIFYTAPPTGAGVDMDQLVFQIGPPWIPLANLGDGMSGPLRLASGFPIAGTWTLALAPAEVAPVPEPASMLLLGSGLAAVAARKYRQSKADRGR